MGCSSQGFDAIATMKHLKSERRTSGVKACSGDKDDWAFKLPNSFQFGS